MITRLSAKKITSTSWELHWVGCSSSPIAQILEGPWQNITVYPTMMNIPSSKGELLGKFQVYDLQREKVVGHANTLKQCKELFLACL